MEIKMGIIKIEVSLPEAVSVITEFKNNRIQALETIGREVKSVMANAFNQLL